MAVLYRLWFLFSSFVKLYVIAIPCLLSQIIFKTKHPSEIDVPVVHGTVAIVTGGGRGIGFQISRQLARVGVHVIIGVREKDIAMEAISQIQKEIPEAKVEAIELDLCSFTSVRKFAEEFLAKELPLHILINNAGVMLVPEALTVDGNEEHFQVNYLSHYLLTSLLLGKLLAAGQPTRHSRVINMSSHVHYVGHVNMEDLNARVLYSSHAAYAQSKLALLLFSSSLQHRMTGVGCVTVNSTHPGVVDTDLFRHTSSLTQLLSMAVKWMYKTPEEGAYTPLYLALSSHLEGLGCGYYDNCEKMAAGGGDMALEEALWKRTRKMTGLPPEWTEGCRGTVKGAADCNQYT